MPGESAKADSGATDSPSECALRYSLGTESWSSPSQVQDKPWHHETGRRFVAKPVVAAPVPSCAYASLGFVAHLLVEPGSPAYPLQGGPVLSIAPIHPIAWKETVRKGI